MARKKKQSVFERLQAGRLNRRQRKELERQLYSPDPGLEVVHPDAAGIDIGSQSHMVAIPPDRDEQPVQEFGSWTADLERMAEWLKGRGIRTVAIQSTGIYWFAAYDVLEKHGIEVYLVNARHTKNLPGRKSDVQESQWLMKLHTYGLLRNSFRPPEHIRELRTIWRLRDQHVKEAGRSIQHMQKALISMNLQLSNAISDISGVSGQAIIQAILAGERDRYKLAQLCDRRIQASQEEIARSLEGTWQGDQLFALRQAADDYSFRQKQLSECDQQLQQYLGSLPTAGSAASEPGSGNVPEPPAPGGEKKKKNRNRVSANAPRSFDLRGELTRICGVDPMAIPGVDVMTVMTIVAELGTDLKSKFSTEGRFTSWLKACPRRDISGGKVIRQEREKSSNRVLASLRMAASTLLHSDSYLGAKYRYLRSRLGAPKAIKAMARILACHIYRMLLYRQAWVERSNEAFEQRRRQSEQAALESRALALGLKLVPLQAQMARS